MGRTRRSRPSSAPYPYPAVSHEPRIQQLSDDLTLAGYHPFHAPCGIRLDEDRRPFSACVRCMSCDGFPCLVHGKSDADVLGVRPALEHSNVTLMTNARAMRLETSASGREVTAVIVERDGQEERIVGNVVVVACGAANTARLLLASASPQHPNGLANGSDQVGRNYMFHASRAVLALSRDENPTVFQKTLGINDFYFGSDDSEFPLGNIQMVGKSVEAMFRGEKPTETKLAPHWTLERIARHAVDFWLSTEDLPRPENRVTLSRDGRLTLAYSPTNQVPKERLYGQLRSMLRKLRMEPDHLFHRFAYMKNEIPVAGVAHQAGTCRFGTDPQTSVLDRNCRAHEVDNLYVVDTSVFPSISAVNPALTAMANSLRVGDHLLERMGGATARPQRRSRDRRRHERAGRPAAGGDPRWRLRGHRRRPCAEGRRRRRRARRQPRLPHLPADALPGRHRPAADVDRRPSAALAVPRPPDLTLHVAPVTGIDPQRREVQFEGMDPLAYDHLVLALGAQVNFFGTEGAAEHAFPMYTLTDAVRLKDHVLERWEAAERDPAPGRRRRAQRRRRRRRADRRRDRGRARRALPHELQRGLPRHAAGAGADHPGRGRPELFSMFEPELREYAKRALEKRGVEVLTGELVSSIAPTRVTLKSGKLIEAHTLVWGAGLQASPLVRSLWSSSSAATGSRSSPI